MIPEVATPEGQFTLLCDYADILSTKSVIVANEYKNQFLLCSILEPYPTFDEYSEGDDFDEGEIIGTYPTWELAKNAQDKRKLSPQ
jgi:hypothetical protein